MATQFPEPDQPDAENPRRDPDSPSAETGSVPLLPPEEVGPLSGQLETAPDGSIRPAMAPESSPAPLEPSGLGDVSPSPSTEPELAPPAPGLIDDVGPVPVQVDREPASGAPPWAFASVSDDTPAADGPDAATPAERAAWPTVEPDEPLSEGLMAPPHAPPMPPEDAAADAPETGPQADTPLATPVEPVEPAPTPWPEATAAEGRAFTDEMAAGAAPEPSDASAIAHAGAHEPSESAPPPPAASTVRAPEDASRGEDMYDVPLGTLVYRSGLLSADQIEAALAESERIGKRLGEVLLDNEMLDERDLGRLLAGQKGLPFLDLGQMELEPQAASLLPAASARIYCALPIALADGVPVVAVSDPTNGLVVEGVRRAMGGELSFAVATRSDLQRAIANSYGDAADAAEGAGDPAPAEQPPDNQVEPMNEIPLIDPAAAAPAPPAEPAAIHVEPTPAEPPAIPVEPTRAAPVVAGATPGPEATDPHVTVRVVVSLSDGDRVDAGTFDNEGAAIERARTLIGAIEARGGSEWPFLNGRFLRPETIISIDLLHERQRF